MQKMTQQDFDQAAVGLDGFVRLERGDYRGVDFGYRPRVIVPEGCLLGDDVHIGEQSEIGGYSTIGARCNLRMTRIGARCTIGAAARIGLGSRIGRHCTLGADAQIEQGVTLGDHVSLPDRCCLFGVQGVIGETLVKIAPVCEHNTVYAFATEGGEIYVFSSLQYAGRGCAQRGESKRTLEGYETRAGLLLDADEGSARSAGREMMAVAAFVRERMKEYI